jgi:hypothetical protein
MIALFTKKIIKSAHIIIKIVSAIDAHVICIVNILSIPTIYTVFFFIVFDFAIGIKE